MRELPVHAHSQEIYVRLTVAEALRLDDNRFALYIRNGCKLPIEQAPVRVQLRAIQQEICTQRMKGLL